MKVNKDHSRLKGMKEERIRRHTLKLFGLRFEVTKDQVRRYFRHWGKVERVRLDKYMSDLPCGTGTVVFRNRRSVAAAHAKNPHLIKQNRTPVYTTPATPTIFKVKEPQLDLQTAPHKKELFVCQLHPNVSSFDLKKHFSMFGEVEKATVVKDRFTGASKCFGFVTCVDEHVASKAANHSNHHIQGYSFKVLACLSEEQKELRRQQQQNFRINEEKKKEKQRQSAAQYTKRR